MRLIESSDPDGVRDADDRRLLCERLALANAVCHALEESGGRLVDETSGAALDLLRSWVRQRFPTDEPETSVGDGLDEMRVPPDAEQLRVRLGVATTVCDRLAWLYTADSSVDFKQDSLEVEAGLDWWRRINAELLLPPQRPAYTRVQRATISYAEGDASVADVVNALLYQPADPEPQQRRNDMAEWAGVVYMKSAGYLTWDQFLELQDAYTTAVLALRAEGGD